MSWKRGPYKSRYKPKNPQKYKGDITNIIARSSLERKFMNYLDTHPDVIEWNSEEVIVPYRCVTDNKMHRYFVDFWYRCKKPDGTIQTMLIEVKPKSQTREPKKQQRRTRRYINEVMTWGKNQSKWKAAEEYCKDRGWKFQIITEKEING